MCYYDIVIKIICIKNTFYLLNFLFYSIIIIYASPLSKMAYLKHDYWLRYGDLIFSITFLLWMAIPQTPVLINF